MERARIRLGYLGARPTRGRVVNAAGIVELIVCAAPMIGVTILAYFDPAGLARTNREDN